MLLSTEGSGGTLSDLQEGQINMNNAKVRIKMIETGIKQWELARLLGMGESVLSRRLRDELPDEEQDRIVGLIEQAGGEADEK